jgi:hypothetical protein
MRTIRMMVAVAALAWAGTAGAQEVVYSVNFDTGLPEKWKSGVLTAENLPAGSKQAVTAAVTEGKAGNIRANDQYAKGHFTIADDLYFNYRIRMTRPQWYQVFLCAKTPGPGGASQNFIAKPKAGAAGEWQVVSLPMSEFKGVGKGDHVGKSPVAGQVCWSYFFDTQGHDRGLAIDRIWVTKGPPGPAVP